MDLTQWKMAKRYGYRRELLTSGIISTVERIWLCHVRDIHRRKVASGARCIRCGRGLERA